MNNMNKLNKQINYITATPKMHQQNNVLINVNKDIFRYP